MSLEGQDATCRGPRAVPDVRPHAMAQPPWPGFRHLLLMAQAERALEESRHKSNLTRSELQCSTAQRPRWGGQKPRTHISVHSTIYKGPGQVPRMTQNRQRDLRGPKAVLCGACSCGRGWGDTPRLPPHTFNDNNATKTFI